MMLRQSFNKRFLRFIANFDGAYLSALKVSPGDGGRFTPFSIQIQVLVRA
ncbi:MAG: hypothetical protein ACI8R9_001173 [Paraglaciecola sp.]|jgi:hypothetical protein